MCMSALRRVLGRGTRVPTRNVWDSRRIWGNCPIPRSTEVERLRVSGQDLEAPKLLAALVRCESRVMSPESLARGIGLSRTLG